MKISKSVSRIEPSLARRLFNMAKDYNDVIDLTLGDPDFSTPDNISNAACASILQGHTHYSANAGLIEARKAISANVEKHWGVKPNPENEIIVTVGGMEALFLSLACMIDPMDEVIIFAPYYVNYVQMVNFLGGKPVIIDSYDENSGIAISKEKLEAAITDKTVAMIINSPNNPTGGVLDEAALKMLADIAEKNDITVISDEVYHSLIFDGAEHKSILSYIKNPKNVVLIDSLSKEFCMTGWRVGYAYADEALIQNMTKMQENVAACTSLPSQFALIEAYNNSPDNSDVLKQFEARRNCLVKGISKIPKLNCVSPKGTFYLFVNIEKTGMDSQEFAFELLKSKHIAVVPGETYGEGFKNYIRIAFTKDISILEKAIEAIGEFVNSL